jgi:hypothetical protein
MSTAVAPPEIPVSAGAHLAAVRVLNGELLAEVADSQGVCVRPVVAKVYDTVTRTQQLVVIPCGSTQASRCRACADKARRLRMAQCREGWHLENEPQREQSGSSSEDENDEDADDDDGDDPEIDEESRRVRSTRRRQDAVELPRVPMDERTVGARFIGRDGRIYRPSLFLTVTLGSYGRVRDDGAPVHPSTYDYRHAALDALHFAKLIDRLMQNLRRCAGFKVQYFAAVEPQRRLAPHLHAAIRGVLPRAIIRQVIAATYHQVWWPSFSKVVYDNQHLPVWDEIHDGYVDSVTGEMLPTWQQALDRLDAELDVDPAMRPAHVVRFGKQLDIQGIIPTGGQADRRIGYLTKYLGKSMRDPMGAMDEMSVRKRAHLDRLHEEVRYLPCTPKCANWLRYGVQPKETRSGMVPGACLNKAHDAEHLGLGGRRVLVSRQWTGKTLTEHRADRSEVVRQVLALAGLEIDNHDRLSVSVLTDEGVPRYEWRIASPASVDMPSYRAVICSTISQALEWRKQYDEAKRRAGPLLDHLSAIRAPAGVGT